MEEIVDLIATDSAASDITAKIKDVLFAKSAEKIDTIKPNVANSMFDRSDEGSVEAEVEPEETTDGE